MSTTVSESEAWKELGYSNKPDKWAPLRIPICPPPKHQYEPDSIRNNRKDRNLKAIQKIEPSAFCESDGSVKVVIRGHEYIFHPLSDTYIMSTTGHFGFGIESLVNKILSRLSELT